MSAAELPSLNQKMFRRKKEEEEKEESRGISEASSFVKVGRHTYLGNVGMSRLGWRHGLMEEILNYGIFFLLRCSLRHKFAYEQARPQQLPSLACSVSSLAAQPQLTLLCYWRNSMPPAFLLDDNGKFTDKVNPLYNEWIQTDQMILSWITSSLTPKKSHFEEFMLHRKMMKCYLLSLSLLHWRQS